jgi:exodeoxyribonuclease V alpha subunit
MPQEIRGVVKSIVYYNEETHYAVLRLEQEGPFLLPAERLMTVAGFLPDFQEGDDIKVTGDWETNPKYGRQFKAEYASRELPVTAEGMARFLGSGLIKGVRQRTAQRIVEAFGDQTFAVLDSPRAYEKLANLPKVGAHKARLIVEAWAEQRAIADIIAFMRSYRIGVALSLNIYRHYHERGQDALALIQTNPYQLVRDVRGIGFKTADQIAQNLGLPADAPDRLKAALIYALEEAVDNGHVFLPMALLLEKCADWLALEDALPRLREALTDLVKRGEVYAEGRLDADSSPPIYLTQMYRQERGAAFHVRRLWQSPASILAFFQTLDEAAWEQWQAKLSQNQAFPLSPQQFMAVRIALTHKISILTGGPGTGKTTALRALITALETVQKPYKLASPTGRAAKRLSQATGQPASTLHRLLGFNGKQFEHTQDNPLESALYVLDETSMLDLSLFQAFIQAVPSDAHMLLVGDVDQLPSVGAGDVLRDLIGCGQFPVTRLQAIFRQAGGSQIITNAHRIKQGQLPLLDNQSEDFFFFGKDDVQEAATLLVDVVARRLPNKFGHDPIRDIQVLSPMYRSDIGVQALNLALQDRLNPPDSSKAERRILGTLWRVGDKVLQTRNNYEKGVFNGDSGLIYGFNLQEREMHVQTEEKTIVYSFDELDQLTLAYAMTVHRAQGSEYPVVVLPVVAQHYIMLQRNLLYTAITRAKQRVVLVGTRRAVSIAVQNDKVEQRWSALQARLAEGLNKQ